MVRKLSVLCMQVLCACAAGRWVLRAEYAKECAKERRWLPEEQAVPALHKPPQYRSPARAGRTAHVLRNIARHESHSPSHAGLSAACTATLHGKGLR